MWMWKFKITGYESEIGEYTEEGLVCGEALVDAVNNLSEYYGPEMCNLFIEPAGECENVYVTSPAV